MAKKIKKPIEKKTELMSAAELFGFVTERKKIVFVPEFNREIEINIPTFEQMREMHAAPEGDHEKVLLKYALGLTDDQAEKLNQENNGFRFKALMGALNKAFFVNDEAIKKP